MKQKRKSTSSTSHKKRARSTDSKEIEQTKELLPLPHVINESTETDNPAVLFDLCNLHSKSPIINAMLELMEMDETNDNNKKYNLSRIPNRSACRKVLQKYDRHLNCTQYSKVFML